MSADRDSYEIRPSIYLQSPEVLSDPYPTYKIMREHYPVCQVEPDGMWAVSRFKDVQFVLANPEIFSSTAIDFSYESDWLRKDCRNPRLIVGQDPPEHKRFHGIVNKAFVNSAIDSLVPMMRSTAQSLLLNFEGRASLDFVEHFSYPYIGKITRHILGMDETQSLSELREWVELEERVQPARPDDDFIKAYEKSVLRQNKYFLSAIKERRKTPQDDLLTRLVRAEIEGKKLTNKELFSMMSLLVSAGFATTIQMLNHAVMLLSRRGDLLNQLLVKPELIDLFIEELLRYSPSLLSTIRITTREVDIADITVPKGEFVMPLLASANHDPAEFSNPETFDLSRLRIKQHLSFGHGVHTCIGAALARLEMKIALQTLLASYAKISCVDKENFAWIDSIFIHGVTELSVSFST